MAIKRICCQALLNRDQTNTSFEIDMNNDWF